MERYALKYDDQFLVADALGDITGDDDGLFDDDTRLLSRFSLVVGGAAPSLLSSGVSEDNVFFRANVTNRPLPELGGRLTPEGVIHIERTRLLWARRLYERLTLTNYGELEVPAPLRFDFAADFADIFEVRGHARTAPGRTLPPRLDPASVTLAYEGLDGVVRACVIAFSQPANRLADDVAEFTLVLPPRARLRVYLEIGTEPSPAPDGRRFRQAAAQARMAMRRKRRRGASVHCAARTVPDLAAEVARGPRAPHHRSADGTLSVRGDTVVLDAVRPRRHRDGAAAALARCVGGARRAAVPGGNAVARHLGLRRCRARQDPARNAQGRAGGDRRGAVRALLRRRRHDTAVRAARRRLRATHRRSRFRRPAVARARGRDGVDRRRGRLEPRRLRRLCAREPHRPRQSGMEGQHRLDLPRGRHDGRRRRSRWSKCRATSTRRGARWPGSPSAAATTVRAQDWRRRAKALRAAVEKRFWLPDLGYYAIAIDGTGRALPRARVQPGPSALHRPSLAASAPHASSSSCCRRPSTTAGGSARSRATRRASIRCPITTARCGRTTPRSAPREWRPTVIAMPPRSS